MKLKLLIVALTFIEIANALTPSWNWAKVAGGGDNDYAYSISTDVTGKTIVAGSFSSYSITFGSVTIYNVGAVGTTDMFLVKYDSNGNVLWAKGEGGSENDEAYSVSSDYLGNVFIGGYYRFSANDAQVFIRKYDSNGNELWTNIVGGSEDDYAKSLTTDISGNILVTGYFHSSSIQFGSTSLTNTGTSGNIDNMFLVKYDSTGNDLWSKKSSGVGWPYSVSTDTSGNILVAGKFAYSNIIFGSTQLILNSTNGLYYADVFLVQYNTNGNVLWAKSAGGSSDDGANSVCSDVLGNVYMAGYFQSAFIVLGSDTLYGTGGRNLFFAKYNSNGNVLWAKSVGATDNNEAYSISTDANSNVYLTGYFVSPSIVFGTTTLINASAGTSDMFIVKYDSIGNVLWAKSGGGPNTDYGHSISTDAYGNVYVTGAFMSSSIVFGTTTLTNAGSADMFISKLCTNAPAVPIISTNGTTFCQGDSVMLTSSSTTANNWSNGDTTQSITVSAAGSYSVTVTNANGCSASSSPKTVTFNPLPSAIITTSGATTFCQGGNVTLTVSSANSYLWSNSAITQSITVSTSGNYTVTVTDGNGCSATSSPTSTTVNSLPSTPTITPSGATIFCQGVSVTLTANSANSYLWNNGATTQNIIVSTSGNYYITIKDTNGCSNGSSIVNITVNPTYNTSATAAICFGDSAFLQGNYRTSAGTYYDTLSSVNSCDSVIATTLEVNQSSINNQQSAICSGDSIFLQGNFQTTAGTYYDTLSSVNGCDSVIATTLAINSNPTPNITAGGATTFCQGNSVTLTASSANSYLWSNATTTQSITVSTAGNYSVTIIDVNGCIGNSATTTITVNPNPPTPSISQNGSGLACSANGMSSYEWFFNGNVLSSCNTQVCSCTQDGFYTVKITDGNGCVSSSIPFSASNCNVGLEETIVANSIAIIPNPTFEKIIISSKNGKISFIEINNVLGETIYKSSVNNSKSEIDLSSRPSGIYFLTVTVSGSHQSFKIIKM